MMPSSIFLVELNMIKFFNLVFMQLKQIPRTRQIAALFTRSARAGHLTLSFHLALFALKASVFSGIF